jgi:hypothetical protein
MAGQTTGPRAWYSYESDGGVLYSLFLDETLAAAGGLTLDDTNPSPPRRFTPRVVFVQATIAGAIARKAIVCAPGNALYNTETSATVTIDGVAFSTTGRRGERLSFPQNRTVAPV